MKKVDEKKQRTVDEIAEKANAEFNALSETERFIIAAHNYDIVKQIKTFADKVGISRDCLLVLYSGILLNAAVSESEQGAEPKSQNLTKPFKSGYIQ